MPSGLFVSAAGLASRKRKGNNGRSEYHDIDINLFSRVKKPGELRKKLAYAGSGLLLVLLLVLVYETYDFKVGAAGRAGSLQERAAGIAQQLSTAQKANVQAAADKKTNADKLQGLIDQKNAIAVEHKKIMDQKRDFASRISSIISALPGGAEYESIEMQPNGISVSGQVEDPFDVLKFTGALEWSAFSGARAEAISPLRETGGATFEVYITE